MRLFAFFTLLFLTSCATVYNGPAQNVEVTLKDKNAKARCYLENEDIKHVFEAPTIVSVQRSKKDLYAYCQGANGKEALQVVPAGLSKTARWNFFNLYSAVSYDLANRTAYAYPDKIEIDFEADSQIIYDRYAAPRTYSEEAVEAHTEELEGVLERARALLSSATPFKVKETRTYRK